MLSVAAKHQAFIFKLPICHLNLARAIVSIVLSPYASPTADLIDQ